MTTSKILEWAQMITGCTAALIVALNLGSTWIFWAMVLFLIKDFILGVFAYLNNFPGIVTSSVLYIIIDMIGVYRWWLF